MCERGKLRTPADIYRSEWDNYNKKASLVSSGSTGDTDRIPQASKRPWEPDQHHNASSGSSTWGNKPDHGTSEGHNREPIASARDSRNRSSNWEPIASGGTGVVDWSDYGWDESYGYEADSGVRWCDPDEGSPDDWREEYSDGLKPHATHKAAPLKPRSKAEPKSKAMPRGKAANQDKDELNDKEPELSFVQRALAPIAKVA